MTLTRVHRRLLLQLRGSVAAHRERERERVLLYTKLRETCEKRRVPPPQNPIVLSLLLCCTLCLSNWTGQRPSPTQQLCDRCLNLFGPMSTVQRPIFEKPARARTFIYLPKFQCDALPILDRTVYSWENSFIHAHTVYIYFFVTL